MTLRTFHPELNVVKGHDESPICFSRQNVRKFVHGCYTNGVPRKNVVEALKNSENIYNDWWLGKRIQNREKIINSPRLGHQENLELTSDAEKEKLKTLDNLSIETAKTYLLYTLKDKTRKPEENPQFISAWNNLHADFLNKQDNPQDTLKTMSNIWLTMNPPAFKGCLGENKNGDKLYTLGRMSFDMFRPTDLICSIQWAFNVISPLEHKDQVPETLRSEGSKNDFRVYNLCTAFTVETSEDDNGKTLKGLMTTFGYLAPDPSVKNRFTIWFTGGMIEEASCRENGNGPSEEWKRTFADPKGRTLSQKISVLAAHVLLGAQISDKMDEKDGSVGYTFKQPVGGHGRSYVDLVYLDKSLRVMKGKSGSIFVLVPMHEKK